MSHYLMPIKAALERWQVWHFFALALALRLAIFGYTFFHPELRSFTDSHQYYLLGLNLLESGKFTMFLDEDLLESIRLPGYPILLGYIGERLSYELLLVMQCVASAAKVFFVVSIASYLGLNAIWRTTAALLVALNPTDIFLASTFLSEAFFVFFLYLGMMLIVKSGSKWSLVIAGAVIGAAALTRGQGVWVFAVLLALAVKIHYQRSAWFALGFIILIGPWIWRNHVTFDRLFYTDSATVVTLFYTLPEVKEMSGLGPANVHFREYVNQNYQYDWSKAQQVNAYMQNARKEIKSVFLNNSISAFRVVSKKFIYNMLSPSRGLAKHFFNYSAMYWITVLWSAGITLFFALGFCLASVHQLIRVDFFQLILILLVVVIVGSSAFSAVDGRFRNPADLSLLLLIGISFERYVTKWKNQISVKKT